MKEYPVYYANLPSGEKIAYRKAGNGPATVLLVHGNMSSSVHWQTTMEQLENSYTVYAPDMRGFGDSSYRVPFDSLRELAVDLEEFADEVGINTFAAVGWSTGGGVVMEMAADLPERVEKLVLLESVPPTGYPIFKKDGHGQPILTELLKTKEDIAADPVQVLPALNAYANNDRETMRVIWNSVIYNLHQPPAKEYERYLDAIMQQRNLVDIDYSLLTFNMTGQPTGSAPGSCRIEAIRCPVAVLHGEKDLVVPLDWGKQTAALLGDRATLTTFPDAGHSPITDVPEEFFAVLKEALAD